MFRPPVDMTMKVLDRSFFHKTIPLSAARLVDNSKISSLRKTLSKDLLDVERVSVIRSSPLPEDKALDRKAILLRPDIQHDEPSTWSPTIRALQEDQTIKVVPFDLNLDYKHWTYDDIIRSILPHDENDEIPSSWTAVGHVAHLNLREQYLGYKHMIAEVLVDKSPGITTVINKVDDVGAENAFRTFKFEVLKGDPSLDVEVMEQGCSFRFDYAKVYWNTRLGTEHQRLVEQFLPGQAVCDVMAGVGPFAVPAAKKRVFVWANDLNPESHKYLKANGERNKTTDFLRPFNMDGREFIRQSAKDLLNEERTVEIHPKVKRSRSKPEQNTQQPPPPPPSATYIQPKTFDHYVMNLPATATHFLDAFIGLYAGQEHLFAPHTDRKLPMIHVHCFSTKSDDNKREELAICRELSDRMGYEMRLGENELSIYDVRDVAPNKRMFCPSFRLPAEVAFRE